ASCCSIRYWSDQPNRVASIRVVIFIHASLVELGIYPPLHSAIAATAGETRNCCTKAVRSASVSFAPGSPKRFTKPFAGISKTRAKASARNSCGVLYTHLSQHAYVLH